MSWEKHAEETLNSLSNLNPNRASKDEFVLYGACKGILGAPVTQLNETHYTENNYIEKASHEIDPVQEELDGAENYYNEWLRTGLPEFKEMARDELKHSEFLIQQMVNRGVSPTKYKYHHDALMAKLI